jgi:ABC-type multidrug transport system fused ATPase/permease subunit
VIGTYRKLLDLMTPRERRQFYALIGMIMVMGILQMLTIASILPLMFVLRRPTVIETNPTLAWFYQTFGFQSHQGFMIALAGGVFAFIVFGMVFKAFTSYANYRFAMMRAYTISLRMLSAYLSQPYAWFLTRNSSSLGSTVLGEVQKVVTTSLLPAMRLITAVVLAGSLIALLIIIRPGVAFVAAGLLGGIYLVLYMSIRQSSNRMGKERYRMNEMRYRIVGEAFGGMKDVKLLGLEPYFRARFRHPAERVAYYDSANLIIREVPRYIIEGVAFGALLIFVLYLLLTGDGDLGSVVPILSVYAFTTIRLFPAMQAIYTAIGQMRFAEPTLDKLHQDYTATGAAEGSPLRLDAPPVVPIRLSECLELRNVSYAYPNAERAALHGLSIAVAARTSVGLVGGTGAGKTTAVDIMLGLLEPQEGALVIDGVPITPATLPGWQRSIGYVPQHIFLTDDTIAANIAFGQKAGDIDMAAVERAARVAELHDFVLAELPEGYATKVGERGVRLSGGQRQRIGIARALYHDPDVLILDEATSALDNLTERAVMDAVQNLGRAKTVVMIAHRLSTVRGCDTIYMLEQGQVVAAGTYDDLIETNRQFRALAGA